MSAGLAGELGDDPHVRAVGWVVSARSSTRQRPSAVGLGAQQAGLALAGRWGHPDERAGLGVPGDRDVRDPDAVGHPRADEPPVGLLDAQRDGLRDLRDRGGRGGPPWSAACTRPRPGVARTSMATSTGTAGHWPVMVGGGPGDDPEPHGPDHPSQPHSLRTAPRLGTARTGARRRPAQHARAPRTDRLGLRPCPPGGAFPAWGAVNATGSAPRRPPRRGRTHSLARRQAVRGRPVAARRLGRDAVRVRRAALYCGSPAAPPRYVELTPTDDVQLDTAFAPWDRRGKPVPGALPAWSAVNANRIGAAAATRLANAGAHGPADRPSVKSSTSPAWSATSTSSDVAGPSSQT